MVEITTNATTLSAYIISFAGAAVTAQMIMSQGGTAMTIKEFKFKIDLSADVTSTSETEVGLKVYNVSMKEKFTYSYKEHASFQVECTIAPTWSIKSED